MSAHLHRDRNASTLRFRKDSRHFHILNELSAGDLLVGFLLSARSTRAMYKIAHNRARERYENKLAIERLKTLGYVDERTDNGQASFFITDEGKRALHQLYVHAETTAASTPWDGKWRIVSYDFPETERSARNSLRHILEKAQFLQIQKSVWVSPYDSSKLAELLERDATVHKRTLFMTCDHVSTADMWKRHFKLEK